MFLGPVYMMDHEIRPWKMAFSMVRLDGLTSMVQFLKTIFYTAFGALTRCKPNVDQEEIPCTKCEFVE